MSVEQEASNEYRLMTTGTLGQLGLGNPEGMSTHYSGEPDNDRQLDEQLIASRAIITDRVHTACIDGRRCLQNHDGSEAEIRRQIVGGTACNFEMALYAHAPLVRQTRELESRDAVWNAEHFDRVFFEASGHSIKPSAHEGGCGGAKGALADADAIRKNPIIVRTAIALLGRPEFREYLGVNRYFDEDVAYIQANARDAWLYLSEAHWDADRYVADVERDEASAVEDLEVKDDRFHGHAEDSVTFVFSDNETLTSGFVINMEAVRDYARVYVRGDTHGADYRYALLAIMSKHVATAHRLASPQTPVKIVDLRR